MKILEPAQDDCKVLHSQGGFRPLQVPIPNRCVLGLIGRLVRGSGRGGRFCPARFGKDAPFRIVRGTKVFHVLS